MHLHDPRPLPTVPAWRVIAALIATALVLWVSHEDQPATTSTSPDPLAACYEDQPCWDCSTMGNRRCGPFPANHEGDNQP